MTATAPAPTDTRSPAASCHRVLVVVDQPCTAQDLCARVLAHARDDPIEALVIAPVHGGPESQWLVDEDAARSAATRRLRACVSYLARADVRAGARLGDPDTVQAIADALHEFPADEILLISPPQRPSSRLHQNVIDRVRHRFAQPVTHIVVPSTPPRGKP